MDTSQHTAKYIGKPHTKGGPSPQSTKHGEKGQGIHKAIPPKESWGRVPTTSEEDGRASQHQAGRVAQAQRGHDRAKHRTGGTMSRLTVGDQGPGARRMSGTWIGAVVIQKTMWNTYCVQSWRMIQRAG